MLKIKPAKNTIILRPATLETKSGLQAVETGKNTPEIGTVVSVGKESKKGDMPIAMKPGDVVVFRRYMENKVYIPQIGEELNFVDFKDIVANLGKQK